MGGLAPGTCKVSLRYWMHTSTVTEGWIKVPIQSIELSPDGPATLAIDAEPHLPGRVSGRIQVDGAPLDGKHCFATRYEPSRTMLRFATDAEGRFEALIPPGKYSYAITLEVQPGPGWVLMPMPERWDLEPGGEFKSGYNIALRKIRVQVLDKSGSPLGDQNVAISATGFSRPGTFKTDSGGWVTVDPAPLSAFHVTTSIEGEKHKLGPIDLPPGQTAGDVTVRIGEDE